MATFDELRALYSDDALRKRVEVATVIAAQTELAADPGTADGRAWALDVLRSPESWGQAALKAILAANSTATVSQISGATDTTIQGNVDAIAAKLAAAHAGT